MTRRFTAQALLFAAWTVVSSVALYAQSGSSAYQKSKGGTAVDVKGIRHKGREYRDQHAPWNFADRIKAVAPDYSVADRARRHQGSGLFGVILDPKTGAVTRVTIIESTGHPSLDNSATTALRRWRWKPGKWKEIDIPIMFQMGKGPLTTLPPDAIRLSPR